jgi:hypothetical protein
MPHHHHGHHHYHQHLTCIMLVVTVHNGRHHHNRTYEIFLTANRRSNLANVIVTVGHTVSFALVFLDQNGNPMLTTPVPDAPPVWTDTTQATGTLTASGNTASEVANAAGSDTVNVALSVGGVAFTASIGITVQAAAQVLTSVGITATVA